MGWFGWPWGWFRKNDEDDAIFSLGERLIYRYNDGKKMVQADPLRLYKAVMTVGPELEIDIKVSKSPSKDAAAAHEQALLKIRKVFGVKPLEEGGLTEIETFRLFDHFMSFCGIKKKDTNGLPTSPEAPSLPTPPSLAEGPPTPKPSDSGSTGSGSSNEKPTP